MTARPTGTDPSSARSRSGYDLSPLGKEERERLAERLSPEERSVLLAQGTEAPFCGTLLHNKEAGRYACRLCGLPLFQSGTKFESGTGWPSFFEPIDPDHVVQLEDRAYGVRRIEVRCRRCDGHLGHVFPDGPPPTGLRYCLNSAALEFFPEEEEPPQRTASGA